MQVALFLPHFVDYAYCPSLHNVDGPQWSNPDITLVLVQITKGDHHTLILGDAFERRAQ